MLISFLLDAKRMRVAVREPFAKAFRGS
jgi:hypothetical protein